MVEPVLDKKAEILGLDVIMLNIRAAYALLMDKFRLRPWEIARLTDRQIYEFYFHPRTKDGAIKFPPRQVLDNEAPVDLGTALARLEGLTQIIATSPEAKALLVEQLKAKFAKRGETDGQSGRPE